MSDKKRKSDSYSESPGESLTIFDAPNVCREMMAKLDLLAKQVDPTLANDVWAIHSDAKRMLDAIVNSVDDLLANAA